MNKREKDAPLGCLLLTVVVWMAWVGFCVYVVLTLLNWIISK